jgi:hypothetical protein
MWKSVVLGGAIALAMTSGSAAQEVRAQAGSYHKLAFKSRDVAAERQALCDHATSVVARAGLANDQSLSQAQLFSLLLLMSLQSQHRHSS